MYWTLYRVHLIFNNISSFYFYDKWYVLWNWRKRFVSITLVPSNYNNILSSVMSFICVTLNHIGVISISKSTKTHWLWYFWIFTCFSTLSRQFLFFYSTQFSPSQQACKNTRRCQTTIECSHLKYIYFISRYRYLTISSTTIIKNPTDLNTEPFVLRRFEICS